MLSVGQTVGSYRITRQLGEGAMGQVFEGLQEEIGKRVAIKVLHPHLAQFPEAVNRFLNEARAVNLIAHPSLVTIFESGRLPDNSAYIVMEFLDGELLSNRVQSGALTIADTMRLGRQIASALQAAHEKNIVHRDLKPENVFVVRDPEAAAGERAKILDFGIAKLSEEQQGKGALVKTAFGTMLGTPLYMSPEQCDGETVIDGKSDVYALGVMLFEMLTGEPPFSGQSINAVMLKHVTAPPPYIRDRNPLVPDPLDHLLRRMLDKSAAARPTMSEVAAELEAMLARPVLSTPAGAGTSADATHALTEQPSGRSKVVSATLSEPRRSQHDVADGQPIAVRGAVPLNPLTSSVGPAVPPQAGEATGDSASGHAEKTGRGRRLRIVGALLAVGAVLLAATFATRVVLRPKKVRLRVDTQGEVGAGRVSSDPAGIDCGDLCSTRFVKGTRVKLQASAAPGYTFAGWTGDCQGQEPCSLQLRWDQDVAARFVRSPSSAPTSPVPTPPARPPARSQPTPVSRKHAR